MTLALAAETDQDSIESLTRTAFARGGRVERVGLKVRPQQAALAAMVARACDAQIDGEAVCVSAWSRSS